MDSHKSLLQYRFPASTSRLGDVRKRLTEFLSAFGPSKSFVRFVVLAVNEAVANIIQHAYGDDDSGDIILEVEQVGERLLFRLTDFARRKPNLAEIRPRDLDDVRPGGLGWHIINEVMDEVKVLEGDGWTNVLQMTKKLESR
jgi:sigma-B regulation protein RsbU (phosphoserine phosphatase)